MILYAGTEGLANAVIDIFRGLSRKPTSHVELQDALLLMCMAYCLAANHAHAQQEHPPSHGDSPWFSDQESAIKVSRLHKCFQFDLSPAFNMTVSTCFDPTLQQL
jgi:hypothetical protein